MTLSFPCVFLCETHTFEEICNQDANEGYVENSCDVLKANNDVVYESSGAFKGYDPSLDQYSLYLKDMSRKILLTNLFQHSFDFSMALNVTKSALIFISVSAFVFCYLLFSKHFCLELNSLLHISTAFRVIVEFWFAVTVANALCNLQLYGTYYPMKIISRKLYFYNVFLSA